mmetsp:Transcript_3127/g.12687  ORF Transcript_3127/g.12687 Transcript_3127/m.12687 type:complete len:226 (-) Transcript_3127:385-1062(-)
MFAREGHAVVASTEQRQRHHRSRSCLHGVTPHASAVDLNGPPVHGRRLTTSVFNFVSCCSRDEDVLTMKGVSEARDDTCCAAAAVAFITRADSAGRGLTSRHVGACADAHHAGGRRRVGGVLSEGVGRDACLVAHSRRRETDLLAQAKHALAHRLQYATTRGWRLLAQKGALVGSQLPALGLLQIRVQGAHRRARPTTTCTARGARGWDNCCEDLPRVGIAPDGE